MPRGPVGEDEGRLGIPLRAAALGLLVAATLSAPASADIYWANEGAGTIDRAENDGTGLVDSYVSGANAATAAHAVAVDAGFLYWAHDGDGAPTGNIGRVPLGGGAANPAFVTTDDSPKGLTLDTSGMYWTQPTTVAPPNSPAIGRANIATGAVTNQRHIGNIGAAPCGVVTDFDKLFWALGGPPGTGSVWRAHGIFPPFSELVPNTFPDATVDDPCGVAETEGVVWWATRGSNRIASVNLAGTTLGTAIDTGPGSTPCGVAVDGGHIYWTEQGSDRISRANLDGSGVNDGPQFPIDLAPGDDPCGIAVDPTAAPEPSAHAFGETAVGSRSDAATLVLHNTSSSTLDPASATLTGGDAGEFAVTGDGCSVNIVAIGQICVLNAEFVPTSEGSKSATLRVVSNATNSPTDFQLTGEGTAAPAAPAVEPPAEPPASPPALPGEFARTLSLSYSRRADRFKGTLGSAKAECVANQRVVVVERRRGNDTRVGSDRTDADGRWRIDESDAQGNFRATAAQTALASGDTCLAARSSKLKVR